MARKDGQLTMRKGGGGDCVPEQASKLKRIPTIGCCSLRKDLRVG